MSLLPEVVGAAPLPSALHSPCAGVGLADRPRCVLDRFLREALAWEHPSAWSRWGGFGLRVDPVPPPAAGIGVACPDLGPSQLYAGEEVPRHARLMGPRRLPVRSSPQCRCGLVGAPVASDVVQRRRTLFLRGDKLEPDEVTESFVRRRTRRAGHVGTQQGKWSRSCCHRVLTLRAHLQRGSWAARLPPWRGRDFLMQLRAEVSDGGARRARWPHRHAHRRGALRTPGGTMARAMPRHGSQPAKRAWAEENAARP